MAVFFDLVLTTADGKSFRVYRGFKPMMGETNGVVALFLSSFFFSISAETLHHFENPQDAQKAEDDTEETTSMKFFASRMSDLHRLTEKVEFELTTGNFLGRIGFQNSK